MKSKTRVLVKAAIALTTALTTQSALAVNYSCDGPVSGVTVGPGGTVSAATAGGQEWGYFCNLSETTNNVTPDACKGILAVLLSAQATGKSVRIWFNDDNSCSTYRSWAYLTTVYWGPSILE